jgi:hypothetical protein
MKKRNLTKGLPYILICMLIIFTACSGSQDQHAKGTLDTVATADNIDAKRPDDAKYGLRSGIIKLKSTTMMMNQDVVIYFDDWGKKQRSEITMELLGKKVSNVTIIDSVNVYNIDLVKKTGTYTPVRGESADNINFLALSAETKEKFNIREEGKEDIIGRSCSVYSLSDKMTGMSGKYYIWNGITLKTMAKVAGFEVKMEALEMVENAVIPADKFVVPQGIQLKELDMNSVMNNLN